MSADVQKAEDNTWCDYNDVQTIFKQGPVLRLKKQNCLAQYIFDVQPPCLSVSRLVIFVSFLPCNVTLRTLRRDGNRKEGGFQSLRTARQKVSTKLNINSDD